MKRWSSEDRWSNDEVSRSNDVENLEEERERETGNGWEMMDGAIAHLF